MWRVVEEVSLEQISLTVIRCSPVSTFPIPRHIRGRYSAVDTVICCGLDGSVFEVRWEEEMFSLVHTSSYQHWGQLCLLCNGYRARFPGLSGHQLLPSDQMNREWSCTSNPLSVPVMACYGVTLTLLHLHSKASFETKTKQAKPWDLQQKRCSFGSRGASKNKITFIVFQAFITEKFWPTTNRSERYENTPTRTTCQQYDARLVPSCSNMSHCIINIHY